MLYNFGALVAYYIHTFTYTHNCSDLLKMYNNFGEVIETPLSCYLISVILNEPSCMRKHYIIQKQMFKSESLLVCILSFSEKLMIRVKYEGNISH